MGLTVTRVDIDSIESEWRELLPRCAYATVFMSPTFLRAWWAEFGTEREMVLLAVREDERLVGVVPLMREGNRLTFAGDTEVCDYMDFPCVDGREPEFLAALFRSLSEESWDEVLLWAMRDDSAALLALPVACAAAGLTFEKEAEGVCPRLNLFADWDEYVASLAKKDRHELKRKLRKLPQAGEVELEVLDTPETVEPALDDFLWMLRESRADKAEFMTEQMERFFRQLVLMLAGEGLVEMVFLRLGGKRTAAVLCFRGEDETLLYNSGYDPAYREFSVGLLSKALALQRAIEQGKKRFDFLRGHERYKYELGAVDMSVNRVRIRRG